MSHALDALLAIKSQNWTFLHYEYSNNKIADCKNIIKKKKNLYIYIIH
jgi:hypothetical protein